MIYTGVSYPPSARIEASISTGGVASVQALHDLGRDRCRAWLRTVDPGKASLLDLLAAAWADGVRCGTVATKVDNRAKTAPDYPATDKEILK